MSSLATKHGLRKEKEFETLSEALAEASVRGVDEAFQVSLACGDLFAAAPAGAGW